MKAVIISLFISLAWAEPAHIVSSSKGRIVGGDAASIHQFPFSAAIYTTKIQNTIFCVGALISNFDILTSAQCVEGGYNFTIILGSNSLNSNPEGSLRLSTNIYYVTIGYDLTTLFNDVGIVRLRYPVIFTDYIKPIDQIASTPLPDNAVVVTFGWGQTADNQVGLINDLRNVTLVSLSNEACTTAFGNQTNDKMVCVVGNYNEGTCRGDLGSPLIFYNGTTAVHVGLSTFISSRGCESTDPSGFTRTSPYVDWIQDILKIEQITHQD